MAGLITILFGFLVIFLTPVVARGADAADLDFAARCGGAPADGSAGGANGVLRCFGFDDMSPYPRHNPAPPGQGAEDWGFDYGIMSGGFSTTGTPTLDTTQKISGAGSMRMTFPIGGGSNSAGSWFTHFGPNKTGQVGPGDPVRYIQYSFRWQAGMPLGVDPNWPNSAGAKVHDITLGDSAGCPAGTGFAPDGTALPNSRWCPTSCTSFTNVFQGGANGHPLSYPITYANCSGPQAFGGIYGTSSPPGGQAWQNMMNSAGTCQLAPNGINTITGCAPFVTDQWMTVKVKIGIGQWNSFSSPIKVWFGVRGQPLPVIVDCETSQPINCGSQAVNGWWFQDDDGTGKFKMGKVYLHPYQTSLTSAGISVSVWYDELIISTQDIADPGATTPSTTPSAPIGLRVSGLFATHSIGALSGLSLAFLTLALVTRSGISTSRVERRPRARRRDWRVDHSPSKGHTP